MHESLIEGIGYILLERPKNLYFARRIRKVKTSRWNNQNQNHRSERIITIIKITKHYVLTRRTKIKKSNEWKVNKNYILNFQNPKYQNEEKRKQKTQWIKWITYLLCSLWCEKLKACENRRISSHHPVSIKSCKNEMIFKKKRLFNLL